CAITREFIRPADVRAKLFTLKVQEPKIDRVRTRAWTKVKSGK
ncbi:Putrescine ABC transporter putrescine-binding protein PotF, partial [Salmonella enterica subsp. enterica serovar Senftenberg str. A4-543]